MATRSLIAQKEGRHYKAIYCHWDGYLDYNGAILVEHYNTPEQVSKLISLGDLSALREKLAPAEGEKHSFDNPQRDVCIFYGRDRGEEGVEAKTYKSRKALYEAARDCWAEYIYVFDKGRWYYGDPSDAERKLRRVDTALATQCNGKEE